MFKITTLFCNAIVMVQFNYGLCKAIMNKHVIVQEVCVIEDATIELSYIY